MAGARQAQNSGDCPGARGARLCVTFAAIEPSLWLPEQYASPSEGGFGRVVRQVGRLARRLSVVAARNRLWYPISPGEGRTGGRPSHRSDIASSWLERTRNPTPETLTELIARFDATWRDEFIDLLDSDDERLRRELAFLVDRRNKIAHGLDEGVGRAKALLLNKRLSE